ncbi:MAG: 4-alpha-glucanotransferase [Chitinophagaceae bacterium]|nr:4-alpha-glucanotransferase [Chitinophagaceae bacterium]
MLLNLYLRFSTRVGQSLFVSGSHEVLGDNDMAKAIPLQYFNQDFWYAQVAIDDTSFSSLDIEYRYILREDNGNEIVEWGNDRIIEYKKSSGRDEIVLVDTWNHAGDIDNAFYTQAFQGVLLKTAAAAHKPKAVKIFTHEFKVKAPILADNEVLCIAGTGNTLGDWDTENPVLLGKQDNWWIVKLNFTKDSFPVAYKYGVYNLEDKKFVHFESGNNRTLQSDAQKNKLTVLHDGFAQVPYQRWQGAGVAMPVFSLRTANGYGTGEFTDISLLVDWAKICGLKLIQLLPVNDTTATHTWTDSYPYAAISAFALHPLYLNLDEVAGKKSPLVKKWKEKQQALNAALDVDYEAVLNFKYAAIKELFELQKDKFKDDTKYFEFFELNRHWLVPYAAFCYLRDKYKTSDYNQWKTNSVYNEDAVQKLVAPTQKHYDSIALHYFTQYHLHLQLKDATAYAHKNGIIVKGDLPIGIYRYGCDAWVAPELYNMDAQAGAPPDDFAVKGQNWGFPTYNWKKMQEDGFAWWRRRFEQMSEYFDAFRIDHILGFFRIWSIPIHAVQGIMGKFVPAIPVHINELYQNNIPFEFHRYCRPYIPEHYVRERFGTEADYVMQTFLNWVDGTFELKDEYSTQQKVEKYFSGLAGSEINNFIKLGLYDLISNVIFFEEEGSQMQKYHFRIGMESTTSFRDLDDYIKQRLKDLYLNYFFRRQDDFWQKEAMHKLPELKRTTNMLVCGEDLGMVPDCVPDVMRQLGILSLEIQRMPKNPKTEFFHPADAPYMSVVTPSTHDMSTIRGWWEEDTTKTQNFYNNILGKYGASPFYCEPWINRDILIQHFYSPAMWCIFQIQDMLGMSEKLRRQDPNEERINQPANPKHYWRYRMHISLEDLIKETAFNEELGGYVAASGR